MFGLREQERAFIDGLTAAPETRRRVVDIDLRWIDFPYEDGETATTYLTHVPLDDEQRALISHRNAERLFRIAPL